MGTGCSCCNSYACSLTGIKRCPLDTAYDALHIEPLDVGTVWPVEIKKVEFLIESTKRDVMIVARLNSDFTNIGATCILHHAYINAQQKEGRRNVTMTKISPMKNMQRERNRHKLAGEEEAGKRAIDMSG